MFAQAHLTLIHRPGSPLSLRLGLQVEPELGMKKRCRLADVSCSYNSPTACLLAPPINKGSGLFLPMQEPQETQVPSLGWEDPLEKEMVTHSSIFAWRIPQSME